MAVATEIGVAYLTILPSAKGIERNLATELAPIEGVAAKQGEVAGAALGGSFASKFAGKTGNLLQGLDRQLGNFGGPFTGSLSTIGSELRAVELGQGRAAAGAGDFERIATGAYVGAGLAAAAFGVVSIKAALGAEQAQAQLEQALKATGNSADEWGGKFDAAGKKLAGFGFDQEEVNASLATLVRATKDPAKSIDLLSTAADLARAKNMSLGDSTQLLANIEAGRVRGLTTLGISTKDATGKTIDAATAVERITALYGGSAAANAKTYQGELQAVSATAHNLEESLGSDLLPAVADLGKDLLVGVHGLEDINSVTHGWAGELTEVALVAGGVGLGVSKIASGVSKLIDLLKAETVATEALTVAEGENAAASLADAAAAQTDAAAQAERSAASGASLIERVGAGAFGGAAGAGEGAAAGVGLAGAGEATGEAVALGAGLSIAGEAAAIAGTGLLAFVGTTKLLDKTVGATKPNVDSLKAALDLVALSQGKIEPGFKAATGFDIPGLAGDLTTSQGSTLQKGFGLFHSSQQSVADIGATNDALKSILQTEGPDKANLAFGNLDKQLLHLGISASVIATEFDPFLSQLGKGKKGADDLGTSADSLATAFTGLQTSFTKDAGKLGVADQLDAAKQAVTDLDQLKLDAAGQGQKSIDAARAEDQAQQSLSDAYRSQETAVTSLAQAKEKLAQFDSPTDTRIRSLEQQNIQDRVVTTPEEARQKEIDLLQFSEDNANKRQDLQNQVASAENGVQSATEGVAKAQHDVSDAAVARRKVQTDATSAIAAGERKAKEAIDAAGKAITDAKIAGQLGAGNTQLNIYVGLLDTLAQKVDPNSPLTKNLDAFLKKAAAAAPFANLSKLPLSGSAQDPFAGGRGDPGNTIPGGPAILAPGVTSAPIVRSAPRSLSNTPVGAPITINAPVTIHGNADRASLKELDHLNKKQAVRLSVAGLRS